MHSSTMDYQPVMSANHDTVNKGTTVAVSTAHTGKSGLWTRITNRLPFLKTKRGISVAIVAVLIIIGGGLAGLGVLHRSSDKSFSTSGDGGSNGGTNSNAITSDTYFYGQSPPVYPSRKLLFFLLPCWSHFGIQGIQSNQPTLAYHCSIQRTPPRWEHGHNPFRVPRPWWLT